MLRKVSLALVVVLAGCGTAQVIQQTQTGGVIELQGDRTKAMAQAQQEMDAHCGPRNWQIVQQGLEAIGTDTYTQQNTGDTQHTSRSGRTTHDDQQTNQVTSTRTATAWRVHYQCNGASAPPPGGEAPPPGAPPPAAPPPADQGPPGSAPPPPPPAG
jgi:hypothetical protein